MWLTSRGTQAIGGEMVEMCPGMGLPEGHIEDVTLPTPLVIHTRTAGCSNASDGERQKKTTSMHMNVLVWGESWL